MTIEKPRQEDFEEISAIAREIHEQHIAYRPDLFQSVEYPLLPMDYQALVDNNEMYIAKENGIIAGSVTAKIREQTGHGHIARKVLSVEVLVIKQGYHGQGIGTLLMRHVMDAAKAESCTAVELSVHPENGKAIRFYEKLGMKVKNIKYAMPL